MRSKGQKISPESKADACPPAVACLRSADEHQICALSLVAGSHPKQRAAVEDPPRSRDSYGAVMNRSFAGVLEVYNLDIAPNILPIKA